MIPAYALYRRSTTHQDLSIEEQRAAVRAWATEQGYTIVREFHDDASGLDTARRREFQALLKCLFRPTKARSRAGPVLRHQPVQQTRSRRSRVPRA
jgi:predicted site-specific integrase-resolvase